MKKILIFAGTSEGRFLIEKLRGKAFLYCCVATEYGRDLLPDEEEHVIIRAGRLDAEDIGNLIEQYNFDMAIDTTHPYAKIVTENIKKACLEKKLKYVRFLRGTQSYGAGVIEVDTMYQAAMKLRELDGNALLTVGSKELAPFTEVENFENRIFARVLPMESVIAQCNEMGFKGNRLICMQGPFSKEMNVALIEHTGAKVLVTKDTGRAGGFTQKLEAAREKGICTIVVGRPTDEKGLSMEELLMYLKNEKCIDIDEKDILQSRALDGEIAEREYTPIDELSSEKTSEIGERKCDKYRFFPAFLDMKGKNVLIVGGGKIGGRRCRILSDFSCDVTVLSPYVTEEIAELERKGKARVIREKFDLKYIDKADMVLATTDDTQLNRYIFKECIKRNIHVNAASEKEYCTFYFPGIAAAGEVVVGVGAQGKNHRLAKKITCEIEKFLGEIK